MPDDTDAPIQTENDDDAGDDTADDRSRGTPTHTALQALRAMLNPVPVDPSDDNPNP